MKYIIYACFLIIIAFSAKAQSFGQSFSNQNVCRAHGVPSLVQNCPAPGIQQATQLPRQFGQQLPQVGQAPLPRVGLSQQHRGASRSPALAPASNLAPGRSVASQRSRALESYYGQNQRPGQPYLQNSTSVRSSPRFFNPRIEVPGRSTNQFSAPRSRPLTPRGNSGLTR